MEIAWRPYARLYLFTIYHNHVNPVRHFASCHDMDKSQHALLRAATLEVTIPEDTDSQLSNLLLDEATTVVDGSTRSINIATRDVLFLGQSQLQ
jgi:hypothetical protein